jgi:hypothetical protein
MRLAAVIGVFMVVQTTPSEASKSCMTKNEARQHFGSVHIYWHGVGHCWDATPTCRYHQINKAPQEIGQPNQQPKWYESMSEMLPDDGTPQTKWIDRWVDIVQVAPPLIERKIRTDCHAARRGDGDHYHCIGPYDRSATVQIRTEFLAQTKRGRPAFPRSRQRVSQKWNLGGFTLSTPGHKLIFY